VICLRENQIRIRRKTWIWSNLPIFVAKGMVGKLLMEFDQFQLDSHAVLRNSLSFSFLCALSLYVYMNYGMYMYMLTLVLPTNRLGADE